MGGERKIKEEEEEGKSVLMMLEKAEGLSTWDAGNFQDSKRTESPTTKYMSRYMKLAKSFGLVVCLK